MDVDRRLSLTAGIIAVATCVCSSVATLLVARADPTAHLPVLTFATLCAATVVGGVWFPTRDALTVRLPRLEKRHVAVNLAALVVFEAFVTLQVTSTGGVRHSMWLSYAPVVVLAATCLPLPFTAAFGVGSAGCVLLATLVSGNLSTAAAGDLVVACLGLPLLAALATALAASVRSVQRDSESAGRQLTAAVEELSGALADVAAGRLRPGVADPTASVEGPLGQVWASLGTAVLALRRVVCDVQNSGQQLATAAAELSATSVQTADGSAEQAAAVAETTASVRRLSDTAAGIAGTAVEVAEAADDVARVSGEGRAVVNLAVDAINELAARVRDIAGEAVALEEHTAEIDRILAVIDDLADQTNLLALNAAIEAARAGEHGRGFAVVAAEVRKLAERAQSSTGQIQRIVVGIRSGTRRTVAASEEGAKAALRGTKLAEAVEERLDLITSAAHRSARAAGEIHEATRLQDDASDAVLSTMGQVSTTSEQQALGARSAATAVAQLDRLAQDLREAVRSFDVG